MPARLRLALTTFLVCLTLTSPRPARAYSVLTHEQLIDLTWDTSIVPLLRSRYPTLTDAEIEHARAFAYGGCVIQDIGYYPLGDAFFSDLTHYVRSGDFVVNLFRNAGNVDELAFAVGALSHYIGDSVGHSTATNRAVPIEFPKLEARYGSSVNYAEGEHQHVQTEFAFDIDEIAKGRFAPVQLPPPRRPRSPHQAAIARLLSDLRPPRRLHPAPATSASTSTPIASPSTASSRASPTPPRCCTGSHEPADPTNNPDLQRLTAEIAKVAAENHWDDYRKHAGIGTYMLAGVIYILPKIGPIKLTAVKGPTPQTEADYIHSVLTSTDDSSRELSTASPLHPHTQPHRRRSRRRRQPQVSRLLRHRPRQTRILAGHPPRLASIPATH